MSEANVSSSFERGEPRACSENSASTSELKLAYYERETSGGKPKVCSPYQSQIVLAERSYNLYRNCKIDIARERAGTGLRSTEIPKITAKTKEVIARNPKRLRGSRTKNNQNDMKIISTTSITSTKSHYLTLTCIQNPKNCMQFHAKSTRSMQFACENKGNHIYLHASHTFIA